MKAPLALAAAFAFGILGVLTGVGIARLGHGSNVSPSASASDGYERLEARLAATEARLAEVLKSSNRGETVATQKPSLAIAAATGATDEKAAAEMLVVDADQESGKAPGGKLDRWLAEQGMREELEGFVSQVYEQSRDKRRVREREEQETRDREMRELSEGPYGRHNFKVNSLAKKLELDAKQKDFIYSLLTKYDERQREAKSLIHPSGEDSSPEELQHNMKRFVTTQQQLGEQFESEVLLGLSEAQQQAFKELSPEERGMNGGDRVLFADGVKFFTTEVGGGGQGAPRMIERAVLTEKLPAPPTPK